VQIVLWCRSVPAKPWTLWSAWTRWP
jgi:hypothetical protein